MDDFSNVVVAHSQRHHVAHLYYGITRAIESAKLVVPFYPKGLGKVLAVLPLGAGRKALGFGHPQIQRSSVISPLHLQMAKMYCAFAGESKIEAPFDRWLARKILEGSIKPTLLVALQDYMPRTTAAAKRIGASIWSDQIINHGNETLNRINTHAESLGIAPYKHDDQLNTEILSIADVVSYPSEFVKQGLKGCIPAAVRQIHVPYGVDTRLFSPAGKLDDSLHLVARANSVRKGGHLFLDSVLSVGREMLRISGKRRLRVSIVGHLETALIQKAVRLETVHWCELTARTYNYVDLPVLLNSADFFVMPSLAEGMSLMIPEALSCGIPVVGTKYCGVDYLVDGDNGLIVDDTVDSLSTGLKKMVELLPERQAMSDKARRSAVLNDWGRYSDHITQCVEYFSKTRLAK